VKVAHLFGVGFVCVGVWVWGLWYFNGNELLCRMFWMVLCSRVLFSPSRSYVCSLLYRYRTAAYLCCVGWLDVLWDDGVSEGGFPVYSSF
jgi:hypothetical protein